MERVKPQKEEDTLNIELPLDDLDGDGESLSISLAGASKEDVDYLLSQKHDLQILDQELEDAQSMGDDEQADRISQDYEQRVDSMIHYMRNRGINYQMTRGKASRRLAKKPPKQQEIDKERKEKEKEAKAKEKTKSHRHYLKKDNHRSRGQERTLERRKEDY